jgi:hypothetical protein
MRWKPTIGQEVFDSPRARSEDVALLEGWVDAERVGPPLKWLRSQRGVSLSALSETTGISKSTLSRL